MKSTCGSPVRQNVAEICFQERSEGSRASSVADPSLRYRLIRSNSQNFPHGMVKNSTLDRVPNPLAL